MLKKDIITLSVVYNPEEIYARNFVDALDHEFYNFDGLIEWDQKLVETTTMSASLDGEELELDEEELEGEE